MPEPTRDADHRQVAIPGGRRGLSGAEMVRIDYSEDAADVEVRVPSLTSAICVKSAAALDARTAGHPRHIQDTTYLLACVEDLRAARDALSDPDRANLRLLADRLNDRADAAWAPLAGDDHDRALAAFRFLTP